ncbi:serine/threonine protein kinase [Candidatus Woesearchaeota archaeon]|nr:serine/threonine protein kinase [Candidatus Woesearchaeota archaeon]
MAGYSGIRGPKQYVPGYSPVGVVRPRSHAIIARGSDDSLYVLKVYPGRLREERFTRERISLETISEAGGHPNLPAAHLISQDVNRPFTLLPYYFGVDLHDFLAFFGRIPAEDASRLLGKVCDALSRFHQLGGVSNDVKPPNIFLRMEGGNGHPCHLLDFSPEAILKNANPVLLDFDIAYFPGMAWPDDRWLAGTLPFIPPEQLIDGAAENPTEGVYTRMSDIYCLGMTLYQMATGVNPFEDGNGAVGRHESFSSAEKIEEWEDRMIIKTLMETPKLPSSFIPGIPQKLDALIMASLEKKPEDRPQSAEEFKKALLAH